MFPPPTASWISDHNIAPEPRFAKFSSRDAGDDVVPKASEVVGSITLDHIFEFSTLYHIPPDYELILPNLHERSTTPPGCFTMYKKHLK